MDNNTIDMIWTKIQMSCTLLGGWLGVFLGEMDGMLIALIVFCVLDYISGMMCAIVEKSMSSEVGFKGIFKKILIFSLVGIGHIIDVHVVQNGNALRSAIIFFYLTNEGLSLIENISRLGLPIPDKLKTILAQLHNHGDKTKKDEKGKMEKENLEKENISKQ